MDHVTAYPLTWPDGWKRKDKKESSRFGKVNKPVSIARATQFVLDELNRMRVKRSDIIISSNLKLRIDGQPYSVQRKPEDMGVSVWWAGNDGHRVIALDKYDNVADNLYAIGKTIEALRGIDRWGGGEILQRTFSGFVALEHIPESWRDVLEYYGEDKNECYKQVSRMKMRSHPDKGGTDEWFYRVSVAEQQAKEYFGEKR